MLRVNGVRFGSGMGGSQQPEGQQQQHQATAAEADQMSYGLLEASFEVAMQPQSCRVSDY